MKRIGLVLALTIMALMSVFAENVTVGRAQKVAESLLKSKTGQTPNIHLIEYADQASFNNFYVFGNNNCFVIVSTDDRVTPILGYSTENSFCVTNMPENLFCWLKAYDDEVTTALSQHMEATEEILSEWESLINGKGMIPKTRASVSPLIKTTWGQGAPFNGLCPETSGNSTGHAYAGCVATAMAQIMNYWEHPVRGTGSHSYNCSNFGQLSANFEDTTYDWDNMRNTYSFDYNPTEANAVATLIFHCGVSVNMSYGDNGSSAYSTDVPNALTTYFGFANSIVFRYKSSYSNSQWISMLKSELNNARPVYYIGRSSDVGHAFVCDGYNSSNYFHFNWGWYGHCNGYYAMGALNPGPGGIGSGTQGQYNLQNAAIFSCVPSTPPIDPPTNINSNVNGRNVTLTWNAANGAMSYKIYRDGNLLANNVTGTSYTDNNVPYGNRKYYLKSVASDGTMSLKSANCIADVHFTGPIPINLQGSPNSSNALLTWTAPASETTVLQYGTSGFLGGVGYTNDQNYWAQRFPASTLAQYAGMAINKVSVYFRELGAYILYVYKGDETGTWELVQQKNYTCTGLGWKDITFSSPTFVDYTKDLWIVMYAPSSISYPATYCSYSGSGMTDAAYISKNGDQWTKYGNNDVSWLIKTYMTDGTYTYRVYRNNNIIATTINGTTYIDSNLQGGTYDYHITTNYYGGESDASNTASVHIQSYNISVSADPNVGGSVQGGGVYVEGGICTVTATASTGYSFVKWTENGTQVSTNANYTFTVNANRNLVAHFQLQSFSITTSANPLEGGSTTGGGAFYYGDNCTLIATANPGYTFINWTKNGSQVSTNAFYTFTVTETASYVAHFQMQNYNVAVTANPDNGGNVSGGGIFNYGETCTVHATANTGYTFMKWTENGTQVSTNASYTFTVNANRNLVAFFQLQSFTITASANPASGGRAMGSGTYQYGNACTLTAIPNMGFDFIDWTENGIQVSTDANYTFTVEDNRTLNANFSICNYTITATTDPESGGSITGTGNFNYGETCTLSIEPYTNYTFINWTEDGEVVSEEPIISFTVENSRSFVAHLLFYDGISDYKMQMELYPNPVDDQLYIIGNNIQKYVILNALGQAIESVETNNQTSQSINMKHYEPAIYIIMLYTPDGIVTKRIVKR